MIVLRTSIPKHGCRDPRFVPAWHMTPVPFWRKEEEAAAGSEMPKQRSTVILFLVP
jgi:hypothetical protein